MNREALLRRGPLVGLIFAVAATAVLSKPPGRPRNEAHLPPLLPRIELLEGLGAGYRQLLADYFWVETLQAVIAAATPEEARDIYDYANLVIELDPKFRPIYEFAAVTLPMRDHKGIWHNTAESTDILQRGVKAFPQRVFLRIVLAYNLTTYDHDYARAAKVLDEASKLKGAPKYVGALATRLYAQAGNYDSGLMLAETLARSADSDTTRAAFERRAKEIQLERILHALDLVIARFQAQHGRPPQSVQELVENHLIAGVPADPLGGEIVIGPDHRSRSTAETRRLEIAADSGS